MISLEWCNLGEEEVPGIENVVANKFKGRAVKIVASGARHHINHSPATPTIFGGVLANLDIEFLYGIDGGNHTEDVGESLLIVATIEVIRVFRGRLSCRSRAEPTAQAFL